MRAHSPWKEPPWGTWTEGGSAVEEVRDGSHWVFDGGGTKGGCCMWLYKGMGGYAPAAWA